MPSSRLRDPQPSAHHGDHALNLRAKDDPGGRSRHGYRDATFVPHGKRGIDWIFTRVGAQRTKPASDEGSAMCRTLVTTHCPGANIAHARRLRRPLRQARPLLMGTPHNRESVGEARRRSAPRGRIAVPAARRPLRFVRGVLVRRTDRKTRRNGRTVLSIAWCRRLGGHAAAPLLRERGCRAALVPSRRHAPVCVYGTPASSPTSVRASARQLGRSSSGTPIAATSSHRAAAC